jgi:hypothetical protein
MVNYVRKIGSLPGPAGDWSVGASVGNRPKVLANGRVGRPGACMHAWREKRKEETGQDRNE